jgi:hypothetical protein
MTPDERRRQAVAILASGLRRLRDRVALAADPVHEIPSRSASEIAPEIPSEAAEKSLEAVPDNPLSVHVG